LLRIAADVPATGMAMNIQTRKSFAIADGNYTDGWEFQMNITVYNATETNLKMKFGDWIGTSGRIAASGNMKIALVDNVTGVQAGTVGVAVGNNYTDQTTALSLVDEDPIAPGIQETIYIYVKVPVSTAGGSYSTSYGVNTTSPG
jgi:hypothetical protein